MQNIEIYNIVWVYMGNIQKGTQKLGVMGLIIGERLNIRFLFLSFCMICKCYPVNLSIIEMYYLMALKEEIISETYNI